MKLNDYLEYVHKMDYWWKFTQKMDNSNNVSIQKKGNNFANTVKVYK